MADAEDSGRQVEGLDLISCVGFAGTVPEGLILMPDKQRMIFPLGSTVVVREVANPQAQRFLQGHSDRVTCIALSPSGRYLASGQCTHMGFQADVVVWDLERMEILHRMRLHKVKVQSVAFSCNERWLASLGGEDDNSLVIWDLTSGKAVCGSAAANDPANVVKFFRHNDFALVTAGKLSMRTWEFDLQNRKIRPTDCNLGKLQRTIVSMYVDENDHMSYCGTTSGDVLAVNLRTRLFKDIGPKTRISQGVTAINMAPSGDLIIGAGDGAVALMRTSDMKILKTQQLNAGTVTTIAPHGSSTLFFAGTAQSATFIVKYEGLQAEIRSTGHSSAINDVTFPCDYSELFATCSFGDIRLWNSKTCAELLRIQIPNLSCNCVRFSRDGKAVIAGWSDGKIRAFGPQSGKLLYAINDAHVGQVTALACCSDPEKIVSGGSDGSVRVWRVTRAASTMVASMKEHKATVNCIHVRANDSECVSASSDGSCIIWDMRRLARNNSLFASTFFKGVLYHPDESQLITCGTDRKITNWDAFDGSAIRIVDGSTSAEINSIDISRTGETFVSGGGDSLVKVWNYDEGVVRAVGAGHSGTITQVAMSPDQQTIVSVGDEGAILIWRNPPSLTQPSP
eukprot:CAMPEP_0114556708 /NCGR_PEP_ID=MMETSP0114-20121206/9432_1 /TAXON_ID=31324 /ORGANISM="Goniomonas sp, Strain m" /LENGTH=623 /DNA_ID=CAMNT_0001741929 /DNA_START=93 /DNA_END=1964 /DNA_ORIENTATION=-